MIKTLLFIPRVTVVLMILLLFLILAFVKMISSPLDYEKRFRRATRCFAEEVFSD